MRHPSAPPERCPGCGQGSASCRDPPANTEQIRRGSGLPHDVREHQGLQPCGVGPDFAYHASALELQWTQAPPKHGHICNLSRSAHQRKDASTWLNFSQLSHGPTRPPTLDEAAALSWLACGDGTSEPIEPLSGVARHPFFPTGCPSRHINRIYQYDLSYLVLKNVCRERRGSGRRNLFFDLGSSEYDNNPINLAFDAWGVPAAFVRGVFEYPLRTT